MNKPQVTISIPTFNSAAYIEKCLDAIAKQSYKTIEINLVDGGSTDQTIALAQKMGVNSIISCKDALLAARYEGVKAAKGDFLLLLDSDQILNKTTIERAIDKMEKEGLDMLVLEETVYKKDTFIEKLFDADRKLIHNVADLSPFTGVVLPRFYRKSVLLTAMQQIPSNVLREVGGQDHAIIYYEVWQLSQKVGVLSQAVAHMEPSSYKVMWKKFYRWGKTSAGAHATRYDTLLKKKEKFRTGLFTKGLMKESFASILLLLLKGVPYKLGYYHAKLAKAPRS